MGDDAGAIMLPCTAPARYPAIENELDLLGPAEIEVLADHLFEEHATMQGSVEHLRGRELRLQDRDVIAVAGFAVCRREGVRQQPQPFAQQGVDLGGGKTVADRLETFGIGALQDAVVERFESDTFLRELALGMFMAVQAQLGIERKVAAELEKERPEVAIDGVDVIVVHHRAAPHDPRIGPSGLRIAPPLGAEHGGVLLGLADEYDPFLAGKTPQMFGHHRVLALPLFKLHEGNLMPGRKVFERPHKAPRHRTHQRRRRQRLAAVVAKEPVDAMLVLQARHIDIQVHPVDPLDRQAHMTLYDLGDALCYHPPGSGRAGFASRRRLDRSSVQTEPGSTRVRHVTGDRSHNRHTPRRSEAKPR
jgi:hypothetical protein